MNKTKIKKIEEKAKALQKQFGGRIFVFPIDESNTDSKYAFTVDTGNHHFKTFEKELDMTEAAAYISTALDAFESEGFKIQYEKDVRFIIHNAQLNSTPLYLKVGKHITPVNQSNTSLMN